MQTNPNVKNRFDEIANNYESTRRKFIPDFDNFYESGINFLQCEKSEPRVLDLGAGTGLYSLKLLKRYPEAKITLIDFAGNMLDIARNNFEGNQNISFIQDDYGKHDFAGEKFDIIISALSIHHFDDDGKKMIYEKSCSLLSDGGEFLNADQINADSEKADKIYREIQANFVRRNAAQSEYEQYLKNIELDLCSPLFPQLDWLKTAGFSQAECLFKLYLFAVMYGRK